MNPFPDDAWVRQIEDDGPNAHWICYLSDGSFCVQDDGRPGTEGTSWERLKTHCEANELWVTNLGLRFRSVVHWPLPKNAPAYFFRRSIVAFLTGSQSHLYLLGHLEGDQLVVQKWLVPELVHVETESRIPGGSIIARGTERGAAV